MEACFRDGIITVVRPWPVAEAGLSRAGYERGIKVASIAREGVHMLPQRLLFCLLCLAFLLAAASCGEDLPPLEGEITELAEDFLACLAAGDYRAAAGYFDARMKRAMPAGELGLAWKSLQEQAGEYQNVLARRMVTEDGYQTVVATTQFEEAVVDIRMVFNQDRRIAGLWFRPPEWSGEEYTYPSYVDPESFTEEEVAVGEGQWTLPGTLTLPEGPGPFPAVILVHGSGPQDRDETIGPNKPFRDLAGGLASRGIAVLRYEKRTREHADKMAAQQETLTVWDETVEDVLAAALLRRTERIDAGRIYVLGHSLGGTLAPRIGAEDPGLAGLVILAGAARPLEDLILEQYNYLARLDGKLTDREKEQLAELEEQVARVKEPGLSRAVPAAELPLSIPASYWLDLRGYSPAETAQSLPMPLLILQGERDYQVTMEDFALWQEHLAGSEHVKCKSYPGLNHLFMEGEGPGRPEEYFARPGHISGEVVDDIAHWINSR